MWTVYVMKRLVSLASRIIRLLFSDGGAKQKVISNTQIIETKLVK